jgi:hypothetical protein
MRETPLFPESGRERYECSHMNCVIAFGVALGEMDRSIACCHDDLVVVAGVVEHVSHRQF